MTVIKDNLNLKTEKMYKSTISTLEIKQIRVTLIIFSILYAFFAITDYKLLNAYWQIICVIRFGIVIPILIITLFLTYKKIFIRIYQKLILINFIIAGAGMSYVLILKSNNFIFYGGIIIYFCGYLLIKLDYRHASIGGISTFLLYFASYIIYHGKIDNNLIFPSVFIICANIIGMLGSYNIETISRENFQKSLIINEYNINLESQIEEQTKEIIQLNTETVFALAKLVETRDDCAGLHIENVGKYCRIISEGLSEEASFYENISKDKFFNVITVASALHDIGKVGISDNILNKLGKLDESEFEIMKTHTKIGSEILAYVQKGHLNNDYVNMGLKITKHHHERYDGYGYPDGLKGDEIPLCARIMKLCDVYDALTSERPYKEAYSHERAVKIIQSENYSHFDPIIVEIFLERQQEFIKSGGTILATAE